MDSKEEIIWRRIRQKDVGTFEGYYKENYKSFFLMACKYLKDANQAEEIVNDVFLKIWEDGENIRIETSLKSYIYKAIINRCINALQKNKRELAYQTDLTSVPDESYELRQIEENELAVKLYAAIDQLPDQCRKVFEMSRFEEMKQQEIADKLGISIKTVKNHITIALKQLSKAVLNYLLPAMLILENLLHF
ncbi:MAG TPA: RNA polymerase sigma-70 factor [Bacteroidales bacterium]